jgi:arylsulfatase A-like enzyme
LILTKPGTVNTNLVQNLDYAETFLEIAGEKIPADMQGHSLVPLLKGQQPADWRDAIYYHDYQYPSVHMVPRHYGIRTKRYKLIRFYQFDEWEFYDLEEDPNEMSNQYGSARYAEIIAGLKGDLEKLPDHYVDATDISVMPADWQEKYSKNAPQEQQ